MRRLAATWTATNPSQPESSKRSRDITLGLPRSRVRVVFWSLYVRKNALTSA
jgi:hypothetical protein